MTKVYLNDFIKTGHLGNLKLNDNKDKVKSVLGSPEKISSPNIPGLIWKYGNVEITFGIDGIASIMISIKNMEDLWKNIKIEDGIMFMHMNVIEFEIFLQSINIIDYQRGVPVGEGKIYFLPNYINVSFSNDILSSISVCDFSKMP